MIKTKIEEPKIRTKDIVSLVIIILVILVYVGNDSLGTAELGASVIIFFLGLKNGDLKKAIPVFLLVGVILILYLTSGQVGVTGFNAPVKHVLKFVHLLFAFVCYLYLKSISDDRWKKYFVIAAICAATINCIHSLQIVLSGNKYAIRYAAQFKSKDASIAGFSQTYGIPFLVVIVCFLILYVGISNWKIDLALLAVLGVFLYYLFCSLLVTAMLLTAMGVFILLYLKVIRRSTATALAFLLIVVVAIAAVIFIFPEQVMELTKKATAGLNFVAKNRILYIAETVLQVPSGIRYSYGRRMEIASYSINTFLKYPFFGVGYAGFGYGVIGCHQEWLDLLGTFGLIGSLIVWGIMIWMAVTIFKGLESKAEKELFITLLIMFIVLGFLNPGMGSPLLIAIFTVAPNVKYFYSKKRKEQLSC